MSLRVPDDRLREAASLSERFVQPASWSGRTDANETALDRLARWQATTGLEDAGFAAKFANKGLSIQEVLALLTAPSQPACGALSWMAVFIELVSDYIEPNGPSTLDDEHLPPFSSITTPWLNWYQAAVRRRIPLQGDLSSSGARIVEAGAVALRSQLLSISTRALVSDMRAEARSGHLKGDSPAERYASYVAESLVGAQYLGRLLSNLPVLARLLTATSIWAVDATVELLDRLRADYDSLSSTFGTSGGLGPVSEARAGLSDPHHHQRTVWHLRFNSGRDVIYKPRSVAVETHFQTLISWCNDRGAVPRLAGINVLQGQGYGWVEFVRPRPCETEDEVQHFYVRIGEYLALVYLLGGVDFHYGNLIACGDQPVLVDLEGLFSNEPRFLDQPAPPFSVLSTGFLPTSLGEADCSALGTRPGVSLREQLPVWANPCTDRMALSLEAPTFRSPANLPQLGSSCVEPARYVSHLLNGFHAMYRLLTANREELQSDSGVLAAFRDDDVRYIARSTRSYNTILWGGHHPDALVSGLEHDRALDRLWIGSAVLPHLTQLIELEHEALWREDIPLFMSRPQSKDMWLKGGALLPEYFETSALEQAFRRVQRLSLDDCERQASLIALSFEGVESQGEPRAGPACPATVGDNHRDFVQAALAIADYLADQAFSFQDRVTWFGYRRTRGNRWVLAPLSPWLEDGLAGLALFLGYAGSKARRPEFVTLASRTLASSLALLRQESRRTVGAFAGISGVLYSWLHLRFLQAGRPDVSEVQWLYEGIARGLPLDRTFDVTDGSAGCLLVLEAVYRATGDESARELLKLCLSSLIARTNCDGPDRLWRPHDNPAPLGGLAHGVAGIAYALLRSGLVGKDAAVHRAVMKAWDYERSLYVPEAREWLDMRGARTLGEASISGCAWCNGAVGVGLSRLAGLSVYEDERVRVEISAALERARSIGRAKDDSLCHGDMGRVDLFLEASRVLKDISLRGQADSLAMAVIESWRRDGAIRSGLPLPVTSLGVLTGLSGIGYEFLRLSDPFGIPSVLTLQPPAGAQRVD